LPEDVIADASEKVGADYINLDKYLQDIVRDKRYWETKRQQIHRQEKKLEDLVARYEHDLVEVAKQRKEILKQAKEEAAHILAETNAKIEHTIREIKEAQAGKEQTQRARKALDNFKASVLASEEAEDLIARQAAKPKPKQKPKPKPGVDKEAIAIGDHVRLKGQTSIGTVLKIQGQQASVAFGMVKSSVKIEKLEKAAQGEASKEIRKNTFIGSRTAEDIRERKLRFKQDLDVRGMRGDEALQAVIYFVDDAILVGASPVRILHGTGTGALRQLIRDYLQGLEGIRSYHDEHVQFGGAGITVVELA
jgi:DNA mismatch repair protein MutS2